MFNGTAFLTILEAENHLAIRYRCGSEHFHVNLSYDAAHDLAHGIEDAVRNHRGTVHDDMGRAVPTDRLYSEEAHR